MYCTSVDRVIGTERDASGDGWQSRRLMLASEKRPFSVHQTTVAEGAELRFCYRRHSETVYCLKGHATLTDLASGDTRSIEPGVLYSVTIGEHHQLTADEETVFLCIFDPPLVAQEEAD